MASTRRRTIAAAVSFALLASVLSGCTDLFDDLSGGFVGSSVTVQPLFARGDSGGVASQEVSVQPSADGDVRVDISENEVSGFGDMTRAASWNAVTVATLLTGAPLATEYRFTSNGLIDGPSAGALTTVAILSLYFGDEISSTASMTGTINPTGTVGTVGGIPQKIQGVIDDGRITKVMIPAGQRNSTDASGNIVDVVDLGASAGVEVVEVATIYEAYKELTGSELPAPDGASQPRLSEAGIDKVTAATATALARYDRAVAEFLALAPDVQVLGLPLALEAEVQVQEARNLQLQGLQAGAFAAAQIAAVSMEAVYNSFDALQGILVSGFPAFEAKVAAAATANAEFDAQIDSYGTYTPTNLTDAEALIAAYGTSFDALTLLTYANGQIQQLNANLAAGSYASPEQLAQDLILPLIFFEFARGQLQYSKDVFDIGRDNNGGAIENTEDLAIIGSFLRRGATANWAAFETSVLQGLADKAGLSRDLVRERLSGVDLTVALAFSAQSNQQILSAYIGADNPNAAYAEMGYGFINYARNAGLIEKYANNGVLDEGLNLVGVKSDTILTAALDLGRIQVARAVGVLESQGTTSVIAVGGFEKAGVDREGDVSAKFDAIAGYSESFVLARSLAFIGGFQRTGWERIE